MNTPQNKIPVNTITGFLEAGKPFNHLLVKTTGVADPAAVVQAFFADREVKSAFVMDSVICLADAIHYLSSLREHPEVSPQVAIADIVLLNKTGDQESEIPETSYAEISERGILDRFDYGTDRVQSFTLDIFHAGSGTENIPSGEYIPSGEHYISSYSFRLPGTFDLEKFSCWIEYFLYINRSIFFRVKGILNFEGNPNKMILQSVRSSYRLEDGDLWSLNEERENRMIFIGQDLPLKDIKEALQSLMV